MRWPYFITIFTLLGAGLLLFFNILCGASTKSILGKWYWLEANTSKIAGAHEITRWTNYATCAVENGRNTDCSSKKAAYPMSPVANFGTKEGVPSNLNSKHGVTYYLSKVGWAFLLIGLLFTLFAILPITVSLCLPSLTSLSIGSGFAINAALLFTALSASLLTAGYVKARNAFQNDGQDVNLGKTMLAFIWTSTFLLFLSSLFSGVGCFGNFSRKRNERGRRSEDYETSSHETYGNNYFQEKETSENKRGVSRKKSKQEQGLVDSSATFEVKRGDATRNLYPNTDTGYTRASKTQPRETATTGAGAGAAAYAAAISASGTRNTKDTNNNKTNNKTNNYSDHNPETGENLKDVAYSAGLGASGATSHYNNAENKYTDVLSKDYYIPGTTTTVYDSSKGSYCETGKNTYDTTRKENYGNTNTTESAKEALDEVDYVNGVGSTNTTVKSSKSDTIDNKKAPNNENTGSNFGKTSISANAASSLGFDTVDAAATKTAEDDHDETYSNKYITASNTDTIGTTGNTDPADKSGKSRVSGSGFEYDSEGADVGAGATKIGINKNKVKDLDGVYENKSTVLPVIGTGKHLNQNSYWNKTTAHDVGLSEDFTATASDKFSSEVCGKDVTYNMPRKEGAASSVQDTYRTTHVPDKNDLTTTTGYEPTTYYKKAIGNNSFKDYGYSRDFENSG